MDGASILKLLGVNTHDTLRRENQSLAAVQHTQRDPVLKKGTKPHVQTLNPTVEFIQHQSP